MFSKSSKNNSNKSSASKRVHNSKQNALVRGDIKTRWDAHTRAMQWGVMSPNEVRELEDQNPRAGGDVYYDPPNTAGGQGGEANVNP